MTERSVPVLEGRGLVKTFGTVNALQGADFIVDAGTVTALIGDNGAGKSTLVKVLSGYQGVEQAVAAVTGGEVTPEISTDFVVATPDNLDDPDISQFLYKADCD